MRIVVAWMHPRKGKHTTVETYLWAMDGTEDKKKDAIEHSKAEDGDATRGSPFNHKVYTFDDDVSCKIGVMHPLEQARRLHQEAYDKRNLFQRIKDFIVHG